MSRAPAPMPMTTTSVADTQMSNPYGMSTYSMAGPVPGGGMMGPQTNSPLHAMQNMYGNMQMQAHPSVAYQPQHLASPAYMHGMNPSTTQNVAVVDFKPDTLINNQIAQLHHQYQSQLKSLTSVPNMGIMGHDGQYIPATAATPYTSVGNDPYNVSAAYNPRGNEPYHVSNSYNPRGTADDIHSGASHARSMKNNSVPDHVAIASSIEDLVEASVDRRIAAKSGSFHDKSHLEQKQIVGAAVKAVMDEHRQKSISRQVSSKHFDVASSRGREYSPYSSY
jgi:hypothetical protein